MNLFRLVASIALAIVVATQAALSSARAQSPPIETGHLADSVLAAIAAIHKSPTLAQWRRLHPTDSIVWSGMSDDLSEFGNTCASAASTPVVGAKHPVIRIAHFAVPTRRPGQPLPAATSLLRFGCQLASVEFLAPVADSTIDRAIFSADSVRLTAALSAPPWAGSSFPWFSRVRNAPALWWSDSIPVFGQRGVAWAASASPVGVPFSTFFGVASPLSLNAEWRHYVVDQHDGTAPDTPASRYPPVLDTLLALGGVHGTERTRYIRLINRRIAATSDTTRILARDEEFAAALRALIRPDPARAPDQQVGRLLAADWMIDAADWAFVYWHAGQKWDDPAAARTRETLTKAMGVGFDFDHMNYDWLSNHALLARALKIGGNGLAADRAFIEAMYRGFVVAGDPCIGPSLIDSVLIHGTAYLARRRASPVRGEVELMVAEAYGDQLSMAAGAAVDGEVDTSVTPAIRAAMIARSLLHFHRAYALDGNSVRANEDWSMAWRLSAGMTPLKMRIYCFSD